MESFEDDSRRSESIAPRQVQMDDNQYSDGKIRGFRDAPMRALVAGGALVVPVNAPYQWYWRNLIFFAVLFLVGFSN
jgi:hypothetical protein